MNATEVATEVVADVAEEVADQATHIAEVSRGLSGRDIGLAFGGFIVGAGLGGTLGFIFCKRKLETKYNQIAADEIAEMRQHYNDKVVALDSSTNKGDLEEIVRERGYAPEPVGPPMAIAAPTSVVEAAKEAAWEEEEINTPQNRKEVIDSLDQTPEPEVRNVFREAEVTDNWDWHAERSKRSPLRPYIIHIDEREEQQAYDGVTFTYYDGDDVLCNERDEVIGKDERDKMIGEAHLEKFGHGSNDASIVYIRNDQLEMDFEVVRSPNSYVEEVHGFEQKPEIRHTYRRRTSFDDE